MSGIISVMDVSLQNPGALSVHIDVGQMCCALDDVFMLFSSNAERNDAIHSATRQDNCERDHDGGVLETNSFLASM